MVLEEMYHVGWLRKHPYAAFLMGIAYSVVGIAGGMMIYPEDPALPAVAIIALLFLPSLHKLTMYEEQTERKRHSFKTLLNANRQLIITYSMAFLGILLAFAFFTLTWPTVAANALFKAQFAALAGSATASMGIFSYLFWHNMKVLAFCFGISLLAGNGAMLFIGWNAAVWGTVFGMVAKNAASVSDANPWILFALIMLSVLPHVIIEMLAYIGATIAGTTISEGIMREKIKSLFFRNILTINIIVLVVSILVLLLGAGVETYVLEHFDTYRQIIMLGAV